VLGNCRHDVNREPVGLGKINGLELDLRLHQVRKESDVSSQTVELGNYQLGTSEPARLQGLCELRPIRALPTLDLSELGDQLPIAAIQVLLDGLPLRFKAKTRFPLASRRNSVISDELAAMIVFHVVGPVFYYILRTLHRT
jgi:hypothetical protein